MVSFNDTEEMIFIQKVEWLSHKLSTTLTMLIEQKSDFTIDVFNLLFTCETYEDLQQRVSLLEATPKNN